MSLIINKKDSEKVIRETIKKASARKQKKTVDIDRYFGKVNFGIDGLEYQKKIRDEWK
jgi:hypothetical protein